MLQILAPLEFLDVLEEVLGLDTTTISDPIFEYSPPPINGVRVEAVSVATREGDPQIALQARRNHAVTGAQHRFNVVTMPADASRLNNSSANHRVWILCRKSVHELQKNRRRVSQIPL